MTRNKAKQLAINVQGAQVVSSTLDAQAALLAGVSAILTAIIQDATNAEDMAGAARDVVDRVNETISKIALEVTTTK